MLGKEIKRRKEYNQELKEREAYSHLVVDKKIIWRSDEYNFRISPYFVIEKKGDFFLLTFGLPKIDENLLELDMTLKGIIAYHADIPVRLRNSGSSCEPFNVIFMRFYHLLLNLENELDQIHLEEYNFDDALKRERK